MVLENLQSTLLDHFDLATVTLFWVLQVGSLIVLFIIAGFIFSSLQNRSIVVGLKNTIRGTLEAVRDVVLLPLGWRRIGAVAILSFKEAVRRRVLFVFILFFLPFLFAGWYLPNADEGRLLSLVGFTSMAMTWLLLPMVLFVTAMALPNDLKQKTIQTVVTKPIRRLEIIVGRILGFTAIFTLVLAVMAGVSLLYLRGQISDAARASQWLARVPVYALGEPSDPAPLMFNKQGVMQLFGTNVGKEWQYRSHVDGADTAHFYFNVDPKYFKDKEHVRCEFKFDIFKTTKGDPTRPGAEGAGVLAYMEFKDRQTNQVVYKKYHRVENFRTNVIDDIPLDLFKSGHVEVVCQCVTPDQFLGMAQTDLYFLADTKSFESNYLKGLVSIWLKVFFLICVAVSASTILNGFVTVLFTVTVYILGTFHDFLWELAHGDSLGGGAVESIIRIVTQDNQTNTLDPTFGNRIAQAIDAVLNALLYRVSLVIPNLSLLDTTSFVAEGFDIPMGLLERNVLLVLGYVGPVILLGYILLKNREIAA